jgi:hypothetical protein
MAGNRTLDMAMGKIGKKPVDAEDEAEGPETGAPDAEDEAEGEEPDDKKTAFIDMCKAIKSGDYDKAYDLYNDICEGM